MTSIPDQQRNPKLAFQGRNGTAYSRLRHIHFLTGGREAPGFRNGDNQLKKRFVHTEFDISLMIYIHFIYD
ncbi:hypothetical protein PghCCS26_00280 [Paenibacillus glycanilyticus]|uniref:Uncharacterized protein n=1 Tax=Paenibacillus glycanilyticus TaxID=126569 RepID=A0ABQ6ND58_9BACL|nr:hypothetical protein PghCCS26_00280 [Paenibacillus glycanilyticus]